jgi:hypothetical protein
MREFSDRSADSGRSSAQRRSRAVDGSRDLRIASATPTTTALVLGASCVRLEAFGGGFDMSKTPLSLLSWLKSFGKPGRGPSPLVPGASTMVMSKVCQSKSLVLWCCSSRICLSSAWICERSLSTVADRLPLADCSRVSSSASMPCKSANER